MARPKTHSALGMASKQKEKMKALRLSLVMLSIAFSANISAQTVYTTKTGEKYHKSNCQYLKYSKKEITLEKALELHYSPCSVCKPPTKNTESQKVAKRHNATTTSHSTAEKTTQSVQCSGKTQSGARCKRLTKNSNGKCYQHQT